MEGRYKYSAYTVVANSVQLALREIEEEDLKWQEKAGSLSIDKNSTK